MQTEIENKLISEINNCVIRININFVDFIKNGKTLFSYHTKKNVFYVSENLWSYIKLKHDVDDEDLGQILSIIVEDVLGYDDVTVKKSHFVTDEN